MREFLVFVLLPLNILGYWSSDSVFFMYCAPFNLMGDRKKERDQIINRKKTKCVGQTLFWYVYSSIDKIEETETRIIIGIQRDLKDIFIY